MKRLYVLFGLACVVLVMYFHQGASWNANSRLLTVYGLVEDHTFKADRWLSGTGDYAEINGHIYGEKAPLSSLLVVPFYWLARVASHKPQTAADQRTAIHLADLVACAVPFAIFATLLLRRLLGQGTPAASAVWLTMAAVFGTFLAHYGASYFGCMLAAALLLGGYVLAVEQDKRFALAGFLGGCAVLTEYPLVLAQLLILGYLLTGTDRWRKTLRYCLGALPTAVLMVAHNRLITGSLLDFPYQHVPPRWEYMRTAYGLRWPSLDSTWELLFGQYRGLAFYAPALLLLVPLIILRWNGPRRRRSLLLSLLAALFIFNVCYTQWNGGYCIGPRFAAALVALALYEGTAVLAAGAGFRPFFAVLCLWGWLVTTLGSMTGSSPPEQVSKPFFAIFWPKFVQNELSSHVTPVELGLLPANKLALLVWCLLAAATGVGFAWAFRQRLQTPGER